jgi:hypothetical protein
MGTHLNDDDQFFFFASLLAFLFVWCCSTCSSSIVVVCYCFFRFLSVLTRSGLLLRDTCEYGARGRVVWDPRAAVSDWHDAMEHDGEESPRHLPIPHELHCMRLHFGFYLFISLLSPFLENCIFLIFRRQFRVAVQHHSTFSSQPTWTNSVQRTTWSWSQSVTTWIEPIRGSKNGEWTCRCMDQFAFFFFFFFFFLKNIKFLYFNIINTDNIFVKFFKKYLI